MEEKIDNKNTFNDFRLSKAAVIAGASLVVMTILAIIAFPLLQNLIVPDNALKTAENIIADQSLFRLIIGIILIIAILDAVIAWALYVLLKPVNKSVSLLMAWLRLMYATIFAVVLNNLLTALNIAGNPQLQNQVLVFIDSFYSGWDLGLIIFGFHLLLLGFLVFRSGYIPRIIGILVIIASFGYLFDGFGKLFFQNYSLAIGMFTFFGEVIFGLWLLIKGGKIPDKQIVK